MTITFPWASAAQEKAKSAAQEKAKGSSAPAAAPAAKATGTPAATKAATPAGASDGKTAATPAAQFADLSREYKQAVAKLDQLRRNYQSKPDADKKAIEEQWSREIEGVRQLETRMANSAAKAYVAAPKASPDEQQFLFDYLVGLIKTDNYEQAVRLVELMAGQGYQRPYFNLLAGLTHFAVMNFDEAKKYLTLAKNAGQFDASGHRYLTMLERNNYPEMWQKEQAIRAAEDKTGNLPKVKLTTSKGDIVVVLFENEAPIATANFISLVEQKKYDGLTFHRVIPGFMAQGGDPNGDGSGGPGYTIPDECYQANHRNHFRGSLSMANTGERDTGGSQFFINFVPTANLDGKHTVFGRVVEGMDVLSKLERREPGSAAAPDKIIRATVLSKRNHPYEPIKRPVKK